ELAVLVDAVPALGPDHDRKAVVGVLGREVRPGFRQDVGVRVDLEHIRQVYPQAAAGGPGASRRRGPSARSRRGAGPCAKPSVKMRSVQLTTMSDTSASSTVPLPFATLQAWIGSDGGVATVTT